MGVAAHDGDSIGIQGDHNSIDLWKRRLWSSATARLLALLESGPCMPSPISIQPQACYRAWSETPANGLYFRAIPFGYLEVRYVDPRDLCLADLLLDPSHDQMKALHIVPDLPHLYSLVHSGPALVLSCSIGVVKYFLHSTASAQRSPTIVCVLERVFSPRL